MANMEREEVFQRLDRMIEKAEAKGKTRNRLALVLAKETYLAYKKLMEFGNCNTCTNLSCPKRPEWGQMVRVNCADYCGAGEVTPSRSVAVLRSFDVCRRETDK